MLQRIFGYMPESLKWLVFRTLRYFFGVNHQSASKGIVDSVFGNLQCCFVFCSTIGEVNACKPLIDKLQNKYNLVLLTDRAVSLQSFAKAYPQAHIHSVEHRTSLVEIIEKYQPELMIVCEIPAKPNDAPCSLSYSLLREVKKSGVSIHLVNAWMYQYPPSCREDMLERELFTREFVQLFDSISAQTEQVASQLIALGGTKVQVTGNMKFDSLVAPITTCRDQISADLIQMFHEGTEEVFIAGCVSEFWEYELIVAALAKMDGVSKGRYIIAPRHPENPEHMAKIIQLLDSAKLTHILKTSLISASDFDQQVLILNTVGELSSYYQAATICYMGKNHNVLEPLKFGLPVMVANNWNETYPSYPVYLVTKNLGLLHEVNCADDFAAFYLENAKSVTLIADGKAKLQQLAGAADQCIQNINRIENLI